MLLALEDQVGTSHALTAPELLAAEHWVRQARPGLPPKDIAAGPVLRPVVNHGRWIVRCPYCPSANRASRRDPRFLCCECWNEKAGGRWLPVVWPDNTDLIEVALLVRPGRHTRNWMPGETVADLEHENAVHAGMVV